MDKQKRKKIQHHKKSDKRIALLSLAVAQNKIDNSACLTDEEMAVLLDGVCTVAERETFQRHLAACDSCYQHWVELSRGVGEGVVLKNTKKKGNLIRPSHFAWAGSFLAAAASVVLFLNITREVPTPSFDLSSKPMVKEDGFTSPVRSVESVTAQQEIQSTEQELIVPQDFKKNKTISARNIMESGPSEEKVFGMAEDTITMRKANRTSKRVRRDEEMEMQLQQPAPEKSLISQSPDHSWLVEIRQGCLNNEIQVSFWKQKYLDVRRITNFTSNEEEQLVKDLLPLLEKLQQSPADSLATCKSILFKIDKVTP